MKVLAVLLLSAVAAFAAPRKKETLPSLDSSRAAPDYAALERVARHTFSGVRFVVLKEGKGPRPKPGDVLTVKYIGWTSTGTEFAASHGGEPYKFMLGEGQVIRGWEDGIADMSKGERRYLIIPPELGYKDAIDRALVPPNSTLIFDVELVDF
jgi:FKBP-type peptidyl-prolyl cis-trans isomerase